MRGIPYNLNSFGCAVLVTLALGGCGGDAAAPLGPVADSGSSSDISWAEDVAVPDTESPLEDSGGTSDAMVRCELDPSMDTDGDGLLDIVEDADRDCIVDAGETDPGAMDTDGDGIPDGDEDIDRNGIWDEHRGELDPRRADTDGDGVPDADELVSGVCRNDIVAGGDARRRRLGDAEVYLPAAAENFEALTGMHGIATMPGALSLYALVADQGSEEIRFPDEVQVSFQEPNPAGGATWSLASTDTWAASLGTIAGSLRFDLSTVPDFVLADTAERVEVDFALWGDGEAWVVSATESEAVDSADWHASSRVSAIVDPERSRVRAYCEEVSPRPAVEDLTITLVVPRTEYGLAGARTVALELSSVIKERETLGLRTSVEVALADGHEEGEPEPSVYSGSAELLAYLGSLTPGSADQRVWLAAHEALSGVDSAPLLGERMLVVVMSREDTEFREGSTGELIGHALGEPLADGVERRRLTASYAAALAPLAGGLVAVRAGGCGDAPPRSAMDIMLHARGAYVDVCTRGGAAAAPRILRRWGATRSMAGLAHSPIAGALSAVASDPEAEWTSTGAALLIEEGGEPLDVAAGYLYPEPVPAEL
jgi:hypothetical protein